MAKRKAIIIGKMTSAKKIALIIVDVQEDFGRPLGALYVPGGEHVPANINLLREAICPDVVFLTQDWHPLNHSSFYTNNPGTDVFSKMIFADGTEQVAWPPHCVQGSAGATFMSELLLTGNEIVVQKGLHADTDSYSGFGSADGVKEQTTLNTQLKAAGVTHVVCCGLALDYCVSYTARDASAKGYKACVVESCTGFIVEESRVSERALMADAGVTTVGTIVQACEWLRSND